MRMRKTGISRLFPILLMHLLGTKAIARTTEYTPTILEDQCKARCYIKVNQEFLFLLKIILMSVIILIPNEVYHNFYYKKHNIISFFYNEKSRYMNIMTVSYQNILYSLNLYNKSFILFLSLPLSILCKCNNVGRF